MTVSSQLLGKVAAVIGKCLDRHRPRVRGGPFFLLPVLYSDVTPKDLLTFGLFEDRRF